MLKKLWTDGDDGPACRHGDGPWHDCPCAHRPRRGAAKAGLTLLPTEVLIFGNPRSGTPLMQAVQTMGIDLPLKALVWQDEAGKTWLTYNDPRWLAKRHGVDSGADQILNVMADALAAVAKEGTVRGR